MIYYDLDTLASEVLPTKRTFFQLLAKRHTHLTTRQSPACVRLLN